MNESEMTAAQIFILFGLVITATAVGTGLLLKKLSKSGKSKYYPQGNELQDMLK